MLLNIFSPAYLLSIYLHWCGAYWKFLPGVLVRFILTNAYSHTTASTRRVEKVSLTPKSAFVSLCKLLGPPSPLPGNHHLLSVTFLFFSVLEFHTQGIIIVCSLLCPASFVSIMILRITGLLCVLVMHLILLISITIYR